MYAFAGFIVKWRAIIAGAWAICGGGGKIGEFSRTVLRLIRRGRLVFFEREAISSLLDLREAEACGQMTVLWQ